MKNVLSVFSQKQHRFKKRETFLDWLPKGGKVAEVGVEAGYFSKLILTHAMPSRLHLIDAWEFQDPARYPETVNPSRNSQAKQNRNYALVLQKMAAEIGAGRVQVHRGYSEEVLATFPDGYFDWVYIDANHQYEAVKKDLDLAVLKTKEGGLICGHDYCEGNPVSGVRYGVIRAVNEFCLRSGWEIVSTADDVWEGVNFLSYALQKQSRPT